MALAALPWRMPACQCGALMLVNMPFSQHKPASATQGTLSRLPWRVYKLFAGKLRISQVYGVHSNQGICDVQIASRRGQLRTGLLAVYNTVSQAEHCSAWAGRATLQKHGRDTGSGSRLSVCAATEHFTMPFTATAAALESNEQAAQHWRRSRSCRCTVQLATAQGRDICPRAGH